LHVLNFIFFISFKEKKNNQNKINTKEEKNPLIFNSNQGNIEAELYSIENLEENSTDLLTEIDGIYFEEGDSFLIIYFRRININIKF